jgi:tetratricopeptide (TPR) repeat protein
LANNLYLIFCTHRFLSKFISAFSNLDIEVILEIYEKFLENSPNNAYAWTWKGNILSNLGKYEEAIKCYDKSLEITQIMH